MVGAGAVDPDVEPFATEPLPAFDCPMDSERPPAHAVSPAWPNATETRSNKQNNDVKAPRRALRVRPGLDRVPISEPPAFVAASVARSEEHTSELPSQSNLVCRLLL